jgi:hypothetical protein
LNLANGSITVRAGKPESETAVSIWVDANHPAIRIEAASKQPIQVQAFYERWREQQRRLEGEELNSAYGLDGGPEPVISYPDSIVLEGDDRVTWYHRNTRSVYAAVMKHQGLQELIVPAPDPLLNVTFGASMEGEGFIRMNSTALRSAQPAMQHALSIVALTAVTDSAEEWTRQIHAVSTRVKSVPRSERWSAHVRWWEQFWNRSWIRVDGSGEAQAVSRGYALQRFVSACSGRGAYPIKSNGSIFTADAVDGENRFDADYRRWGGPYEFQKTRSIYWPMLAAADYDMMQPLFRMYLQAYFLARSRSKMYFNHEGAFFPESMYFWGAYPDNKYGWNRAGKPVSYVEDKFLRHNYSGSLELLALMLDYYAYTLDKQFLRTLTPMAEDIIRFYDAHYERDGQRHLLIQPAGAVQPASDAVNPMPDVAGLKWVLTRLQDLKVPLEKAAANAARKLLSELPPLPSKQDGGKTVLISLERGTAPLPNSDNAELYAVYPYRFYGVNKPEYDTGRATFEARRSKQTEGAQQDPIYAAYLGIADDARSGVLANFTTTNAATRFPAFWGPNLDWVPDQAQGSIGMITLQAMLIQCDGDKIVLFPAWPKDWDVEFKLAAPKNTTVEGVYRRGQLESLKITPATRAVDVVKLTPQ